LVIPDEIDGRSLRGILEGDAAEDDRIVYSQRPAAGSGHWAAHSKTGTVFVADCKVTSADCSDIYLAKRSDGGVTELNEQTAARIRLRRALDDYAATASAYEVPFTVTIRFRPGDKEFVKQFVLDHNMRWESYTDEDLHALGILGYVDD
jgi:hypothetical protein